MSKKILIVDDDRDIVAFLTAMFREEGYETVSATDGLDAYEVLKKEIPDFITLDLQMPEKTGTDFYRRIHSNKNYKNIPVVVISAIPGRDLALPKPIAVFDKPIDKEGLLKVVKEAIG